MEVSGKTKLPQGTWFKLENGGRVKYFRVKQDTDVSPATDGGEREVEVICLPQPTREESKAIERQLAEQTVAAIPFVYKKKSEYKYGAGKQGVYVSAPGPSSVEAQGFLPVMMAMCFFAFWPFAGSGQPSYMARQMAFKDTVTLRRSMVFVMVYFSLIYFPLIIISLAAACSCRDGRLTRTALCRRWRCYSPPTPARRGWRGCCWRRPSQR
jgi:sodium/pantothenate symporter